MASLTDYFNRDPYQPTYFLGDRVEGKWNGIPFIGTIANDGHVYVGKGPQVSIFVDLPIQYDGKVYRIITAKHEDIKRRK